MKYFKIKNITNTFKKRDVKANTALEISFVDGMVKKNRKIFPDETLYLELSSLPLSIHKMRINGLVTVNEISGDEFLSEQKKTTQPKTDINLKKKEVSKTTTKEIKTTGKKNSKKKDDEEKGDSDIKVDASSE